MTEHQVVVVFDVTAETREQAAMAVAGVLSDDGIESWWFPEADLKQVDRNDNAAMHLEPDDPPLDVYVEDDAEDEPTIWLHNPAEPDRPMALLSPGNLGRRGRELLWDHITRGLPTSPPVPS